MSDSKYGRLFTEQDVRLLIEEALQNRLTDDEDTWAELARFSTGIPIEGMDSPFTVEALADRVKDRLKFPADEPLFLLRAKDDAAADAVHDYGITASLRGASAGFRSAVFKECRRFENWQRANPDKVEVPD